MDCLFNGNISRTYWFLYYLYFACECDTPILESFWEQHSVCKYKQHPEWLIERWNSKLTHLGFTVFIKFSEHIRYSRRIPNQQSLLQVFHICHTPEKIICTCRHLNFTGNQMKMEELFRFNWKSTGFFETVKIDGKKVAIPYSNFREWETAIFQKCEQLVLSIRSKL